MLPAWRWCEHAERSVVVWEEEIDARKYITLSNIRGLHSQFPPLRKNEMAILLHRIIMKKKMRSKHPGNWKVFYQWVLLLLSVVGWDDFWAKWGQIQDSASSVQKWKVRVKKNSQENLQTFSCQAVESEQAIKQTRPSVGTLKSEELGKVSNPHTQQAKQRNRVGVSVEQVWGTICLQEHLENKYYSASASELW